MSTSLLRVVVLACVVGAGCGSQDPNVRTPDWEENFDAAYQATSAGDHARALAIARAYLDKHPDNVDGHLMLGEALTQAGKAASDASRPANFREAVAHFARVVEVSNNPPLRFLAQSSLVNLHRADGLNNPDEGLRYARMLIAEDPERLTAYTFALVLLKDSKRYDEALVLLSDAKKKASASDESVTEYASLVQIVVGVPLDMPHEPAGKLLADTVAVIDAGLRDHGKSKKMLMYRGTTLRLRAETEADPERRRRLLEESTRTFDEHDRLPG